MAYDTWDWSQSGYPNGSWRPDRRDPVLRNPRESGATKRAPAFTRGLWVWEFEYSVLTPDQYLYIMQFFHDHRGGLEWYFPWPFGMYGLPAGYDVASPGSPEPWQTEVTVGYGESPIYLACFGMDGFKASKVPQVRGNYYATDGPIIVEQV